MAHGLEVDHVETLGRVDEEIDRAGNESAVLTFAGNGVFELEARGVGASQTRLYEGLDGALQGRRGMGSARGYERTIRVPLRRKRPRVAPRASK